MGIYPKPVHSFKLVEGTGPLSSSAKGLTMKFLPKFAAQIVIAVISLISTCAGLAQSDTKSKPNTEVQRPTAYSDPFAYCKAVANVDCSLEGGACDPRYNGPKPPPAVAKFLRKRTNEVAWRCMNGKVMGCYLGASGSACQKREAAGTLPRGIKEFCAQNPNEQMLSRAQFGPDAPEKWRCANGRPIAKGLSGPRLDERGYHVDSWKIVPE